MSFASITDVEQFPRFSLLDGPTPIQQLNRIGHYKEDLLRGVNLFVKRDDHMPVGGGGNKLRKLEFHIGRAVHEGFDTVVTMGGLQSNHARLTAAAAARAGLACELVLTRQVPRTDVDYQHNGNVLLNRIFGAVIHDLSGSIDASEWAQKRAEQLTAQGRKVLVIPTGGSTALGCLGYVRCAEEIAWQSKRLNLYFSQVVLANGSAGTHAGLVAGFAALHQPASIVRSYAVLAPKERAVALTTGLVESTCRLLGIETPDTSLIDVDGTHLGQGYGIPSLEMLDAVHTMARSEGLLLDPIYSGKAFAGLLADIRKGCYSPGENVLFVMTGGTPGTFAYRQVFEE